MQPRREALKEATNKESTLPNLRIFCNSEDNALSESQIKFGGEGGIRTHVPRS
jgi:hypothetical protein